MGRKLISIKSRYSPFSVSAADKRVERHLACRETGLDVPNVVRVQNFGNEFRIRDGVEHNNSVDFAKVNVVRLVNYYESHENDDRSFSDRRQIDAHRLIASGWELDVFDCDFGRAHRLTESAFGGHRGY